MINVSLNDETHTYSVIHNGDLISTFKDGGAFYVAKVINALVVHTPRTEYLFISSGRMKNVAYTIVQILEEDYGLYANVDENE